MIWEEDPPQRVSRELVSGERRGAATKEEKKEEDTPQITQITQIYTSKTMRP